VENRKFDLLENFAKSIPTIIDMNRTKIFSTKGGRLPHQIESLFDFSSQPIMLYVKDDELIFRSGILQKDPGLSIFLHTWRKERA
jgi:hypothetical protein